MSHAGHAAARPSEASAQVQLAKLALLGIGTLATGAVGLFSIAAGYKVSSRTMLGGRVKDPHLLTLLFASAVICSVQEVACA